MGIFKKNKETEKETKETVKKVSKTEAENTDSENLSDSPKNFSDVISKPKITEKTAINADFANAYTFKVNPRATKKDVADAVEKIYKVVPIKVNMCKIPKKAVGVRRGKGFKGGGKKAIVYLKKGSKIEFV